MTVGCRVMKILMSGMSWGKGGKEAYIVGLTRKLVELGETVDFLTVDYPMAYEEEMVERGCKVHHVPQRSESPRKHVRAIRLVLRSEGYDVLWSHKTTLSSVEDLDEAKRLGVPIRIAHSHATENMGNMFTAVMHSLNRKRIKGIATDFYACSARAGEYFYPASVSFEVKQNAFNIHKFSYDCQKREEIRHDLGIGESFVLVHVGHLSPVKNHQKILHVFKEICECKQDSTLLLCGDGDLRESLKRLAKDLGIDHRVRFLGVRNDIPAILSASDAFIFPSFHEGLPYAVLEAQANGLPCVVSAGLDERILCVANATSLDLKEDNKRWAEACLQGKREPRSNVQTLVELGYDIDTESSAIRDALLERLSFESHSGQSL